MSYLDEVAYPDGARVLRENPDSSSAVHAALICARSHFPPFPWDERIADILIREIENGAPKFATVAASMPTSVRTIVTALWDIPHGAHLWGFDVFLWEKTEWPTEEWADPVWHSADVSSEAMEELSYDFEDWQDAREKSGAKVPPYHFPAYGPYEVYEMFLGLVVWGSSVRLGLAQRDRSLWISHPDSGYGVRYR